MARNALTDDWSEIATNVTGFTLQNVSVEPVLVTTVANASPAPTGTIGFKVYGDAILERAYGAGVDVYARAGSRVAEVEIEAS